MNYDFSSYLRDEKTHVEPKRHGNLSQQNKYFYLNGVI